MWSMSRIVVLGGCGIVGTQAVKALVATNDFDEIIIGDIAVGAESTAQVIQKIGDNRPERGNPGFDTSVGNGSRSQ